MFVRATNDLAGQISRALCLLCRQSMHYTTPAGDDISVDLPVLLASEVAVPAPVEPQTLRSAMLEDPALLCRIFDRLTRRLPFTVCLMIDQAEEIFTLEQGREESTLTAWALEALGKLADDSSDFKVIVSMRTEYFGRLLSSLRRGNTEAAGVREYLLTDFDESGLVEAIVRPTVDEPIPMSSEVPRERYKFSYAPGVAEAVARQALHSNRKDSVLPLVQVICRQLYDRLPRPDGGQIAMSDLEAIGGVEGGIRRHIESALNRLFARSGTSQPDQSVKSLDARGLALAIADRMNRLFARSGTGQPDQSVESVNGTPPAVGMAARGLPPWFSLPSLSSSPLASLLTGESGALRATNSDRRAFKSLFASLYLRQPDGSLSTALMPVDDVFNALVRAVWVRQSPRMARSASGSSRSTRSRSVARPSTGS